jgi:uncharacterized protein YbbC (DUF1343 family)
MLQVIPCQQYDHTVKYQLPVRPSPNLRTMAAIYVYPCLCFFEGTEISVGRGTDVPFQIWGHPDFIGKASYNFIPRSIPGATNPPQMNRTCYGQVAALDSSEAFLLMKNHLRLFWLQRAYDWFPYKERFFTPFFDKLAGNKELREQITNGVTEEEIRKSWQKDIDNFKIIRKKYLLYKDFE